MAATHGRSRRRRAGPGRSRATAAATSRTAATRATGTGLTLAGRACRRRLPRTRREPNHIHARSPAHRPPATAIVHSPPWSGAPARSRLTATRLFGWTGAEEHDGDVVGTPSR